MISFANFYERFGDVVCRSLVAVMDVRCKRRVERISQQDKAHIQSLIRPGDILVDSNDAFPGWQLASRIFLGSDWVHMGFYVGDGKVIDAGTESNVAEISLNRYLRTTRAVLLRPQYTDAADVQAAIACARTFVGKSYNFALAFDSHDSIYCTQMIRVVLAQLKKPIAVPAKNVLGREIVSPQAFVDHEEISLIWTTKQVEAEPMRGTMRGGLAAD